MRYKHLFLNIHCIALLVGMTTTICAQDTLLVDFRLFHGSIDFISDDGQGNICLSSGIGIYRFDGETVRWLQPNRDRSVFIYQRGKQGLQKLNPADTNQVYTTNPGRWVNLLPLGSAQVLSEAIDKKGRIWVANGQYLYGFEINKRFHLSFRGKSIRGVLPISDSLVVSTYAGIYLNNHPLLFDTLFSNGHLFLWKKNELLIPYHQIISYNLQKGDYRIYPFRDTSKAIIYTLKFDTLHSSLYAATTKGLMLLEGDSLKLTPFTKVVEDLSVHQDKIFLAAYDGIYSSDGTNSHKVSAFPSLHFNSIQYIDGIWWATSREGIWKWKPGHAKAEQLFPGQELAQLETYCLAKDPFGYIWASCISGLVRFKPDEGIYEHYLRSIEFNKRSVAQRGDTIYFGSLNGLFSFHPSQFGEIKATKKPTQPIPRWIFVLIAGIVLVFGLFAYTHFRKWQRVSHLLEIKLTEPNDTADSFLQELEKYIHSHIQYVTVESLIDFTGLSRRGLYQVLETRYQLKPGDLIRQIKQQRIQEILQQQPDISMEELAGLVGYSAAHVIRILKGE